LFCNKRITYLIEFIDFRNVAFILLLLNAIEICFVMEQIHLSVNGTFISQSLHNSDFVHVSEFELVGNGHVKLLLAVGELTNRRFCHVKYTEIIQGK
jgi:hypothetical protein